MRQASQPSTTPKPARPRNCRASKCASANTSAVITIESAGPRRAPSCREAAQQRPQQQAAEEQLLDDRAPDADEHRQHDQPGSVGVAGQALGRMAEPRVQVVDEREQRRLDDRHEQVLGGNPGDDPEGDVRPWPQLEPDSRATRSRSGAAPGPRHDLARAARRLAPAPHRQRRSRRSGPGGRPRRWRREDPSRARSGSPRPRRTGWRAGRARRRLHRSRQPGWQGRSRPGCPNSASITPKELPKRAEGAVRPGRLRSRRPGFDARGDSSPCERRRNGPRRSSAARR